MPQVAGGPKELNDLLESAYQSCIKAGGDEETCSKKAWGAAKKAGWKKQDDKWAKYELETVALRNIEIFSGKGNPNGHEYTDSILEEMVDGFYKTKDKIKPYLKLGHDDKQKLVQNSGMPAIGWVENLRKKGQKLIADFVGVPKDIYELIKAGAYRRISSEIFWNIEVAKKKYKRLLKAVSLLGADTPACGDLEDIIGLYSVEVYKSDAEVQEYHFETRENEISDNKKEEKEMAELEELKEKVKKYEEDAKAAEEKAKKAEEDKIAAEEATKKAEEEKKKADDEKAVAEKELKEKEEKETKAEIDAKVEKFIEEGHLAPVDKGRCSSLMLHFRSEAEVKKYKIKIGEEEKEETNEDMLDSIISNQMVVLNTEGHSEIGDVTSKEDNRALKAKAEKYAKDNKVSYVEALKAVSK